MLIFTVLKILNFLFVQTELCTYLTTGVSKRLSYSEDVFYGRSVHTVTSFVYVTSAFSVDVHFVPGHSICLLSLLTIQLYPSLLDPHLVH